MERKTIKRELLFIYAVFGAAAFGALIGFMIGELHIHHLM